MTNKDFPNMLPVSEVFLSPQGEGIKAGLMTFFIRIAGCNFEEHPCGYCDTSYAWHSCQGTLNPVDKIIQDVETAVRQLGVKEICIIGGEPLWHEGIHDLIRHFRKGYGLTVETNGSLPIWRQEDFCWSMDIKTPSSGNSGYNRLDNLAVINSKDQVKFVISDRIDFDFASEMVKSRIVLTNVVFQPAWKTVTHAKLIKWVKEDRDLCSVVRIGDQLQKRWYPRRKRK